MSNVPSDYINNSWTRLPTITQSNSTVLHNSSNWLNAIMRVKAIVVVCIHFGANIESQTFKPSWRADTSLPTCKELTKAARTHGVQVDAGCGYSQGHHGQAQKLCVHNPNLGPEKIKGYCWSFFLQAIWVEQQ